MSVYAHGAVIWLQAGRWWSLSLFLSLWRVSEGVCIQPLPWRYRPRMQLTQAPSCLYPAPPQRSGLQRWPSESLGRCHEESAGPPTHRPNKLKCCTSHGAAQWPTCSFCYQNKANDGLNGLIFWMSCMYRFKIKRKQSFCVFVYLQREGSFGGHLGHQPLFFPLLKLAEIFLDEEGSVELPDCYLIICKK